MIIRLAQDHAAALQTLRREALTLHPSAFSADPDLEEKLTLDDWRKRIESAAWFGGLVDGELMAMAALTVEPSKKLRHTGHLASMYVRQNYRGTGLADKLIERILEHAADHFEQVMLTVEAGNSRAIGLYERHGFRPIGSIPRSILVDGKYFDEVMMLLALPRKS